MRISVKAVFPKNVRLPRPDRLNVITALRKSGAYKDMLKNVQSTYSTWSADNKPHVVTRDVYGPSLSGGIGLEIEIDSQIWHWLDQGFRRHVLMSPDFVPKTEVRWFGSGPGGGDRKPVSSQYPPTYTPGRQWTAMLQENADKDLVREYQSILRNVMHDDGLDLWAI